MILDGEVKTLFKVLEIKMGETAWPTKPMRGQIAQPSRTLDQHGSIVA
jgi:hypothetical protein